MFSSRKTGSASNNYLLQRSLRFRSSASAYLNRTPGSAGNQQKWTFSAWIKRGKLSTDTLFWSCSSGNNSNKNELRFNSSDQWSLETIVSGSSSNVTTTQVFRDPSAWYHLVLACDTTQATASNRLRFYVNGVEVTAFSSTGYPSQNQNLYYNSTNNHLLGAGNEFAGLVYSDLYVAEFYWIDGQALTPSSFGQTSSTTGVWQPIRYTGTYGTNGFYLDFEDTSSVAALGYDAAGSNDWTVNNISLTSGSTYDSMKDVPTLTDADTANYCVLNPLSKGTNTSITNANLSASYGSAAWTSAFGTLGVSTGKWYWEATLTSAGTDAGVGISTNPAGSANSYIGGDANSWGYYANNGNKWNNGSSSAYGATYANGDVIGVALDLDAGTLVFYKNNSSQGTAFSSLASNTYFPALSVNNSSYSFNFGQQPFAYTPPSGYVALNTFNLPTPTIGASSASQANDYFDVTTYTGTGSSQSITNSGSMQPDFVWIKGRSGATDHGLYDAVRGVQIQLESNNTDAETTETTGLTAFNSNGFTVGALAQLNTSSATYVGWQWKANGSGSSNTAGSITSTVSANTTAGFSVVIYTGTAANATVGHGLGVAPSMVIVKERSNANVWGVGHSGLTSWAYHVRLNATDAQSNADPFWNNTAPTSSVFSIGGSVTAVNRNGGTYVAYCFAQVAGYSAFGSYTGNGSTDGPFVFTGFRPRYVLWKNASAVHAWYCYDSARTTYNVMGAYLSPTTSDAEGAVGGAMDFLSNGFKVRNTGGDMNPSGDTIIYMAFAESPFKFSLAR